MSSTANQETFRSHRRGADLDITFFHVFDSPQGTHKPDQRMRSQTFYLVLHGIGSSITEITEQTPPWYPSINENTDRQLITLENVSKHFDTTNHDLSPFISFYDSAFQAHRVALARKSLFDQHGIRRRVRIALISAKGLDSAGVFYCSKIQLSAMLNLDINDPRCDVMHRSEWLAVRQAPETAIKKLYTLAPPFPEFNPATYGY